MRRMGIVRTLGTLELGGAQLSALRLSAAVRRHGTATTLLAGDATAPGLEVAARYGLPADAYRTRDRQMLASLQWTPRQDLPAGSAPGLAGPAWCTRAVGGWRAAARALPPDVPLVASEHNEMCWPGRAHAAGRAAARRVDMFFAHEPASGAWAAGRPGRRPAARGRSALEGLPAEPLPAQPSPRLTFTGRFRAGRAHKVLVAAPALLAAPPPAYLAGDGRARQAVIRLVSACGLVRLPGSAHEQPCVKRHRFILFQQPLEGFVERGVVAVRSCR